MSKSLVNLSYRYTASLFLIIGLIFLSLSQMTELFGNKAEIFTRISLSVITAGVVALIFEFSSKKYLAEKLSTDIKKYVLEGLGICDSVNESGVTAIKQKLSSDKLTELISKANKKIYILQTWLANKTDLIPSLIEAANRGCEVHVLILNTEQPTLAEYRAINLGMENKQYVSVEIEATLTSIKSYWKKGGEPKTFRACLNIIPEKPVSWAF